jgi:CheY-like chemotaxis protein
MSYRILVVDDSKLARMAVARSLGALQPDLIRLEAANALRNFLADAVEQIKAGVR